MERVALEQHAAARASRQQTVGAIADVGAWFGPILTRPLDHVSGQGEAFLAGEQRGQPGHRILQGDLQCAGVEGAGAKRRDWRFAAVDALGIA